MTNGRNEAGATVMAAVGSLIVIAGVIVNNWTVAALLGVESLGPRSRALVWAAQGASIGWGLLTIKWRRQQAVWILNLLLVSFLLTMGSLEWALHRYPTLLGQDFANGVQTKYTTEPDGIFYEDPTLKIRFMVPNYRTEMYYNGYRWEHQTDALGFRNARLTIPADIVLLGDSTIYGHGVNIDQTVGHYLQALMNVGVANLARQGDCAYTEAYVLTEYLPIFRPWYVVYFYYENDILDLSEYLTQKQLAEFVAQPVERIRFNPRLDVQVALAARSRSLEEAERAQRSLYWTVRERSYLLRIPAYIEFLRWRQARLVRATSPGDSDEESLGWRYTKKAILYMNHISERAGARFLIAPITPQNKRHREILARFARERELRLIDLSRVDLSDASLFLPGDGHLSPVGARVIAEIVAADLKRQFARVQVGRPEDRPAAPANTGQRRGIPAP
jgi:hypothetical protein